MKPRVASFLVAFVLVAACGGAAPPPAAPPPPTAASTTAATEVGPPSAPPTAAPTASALPTPSATEPTSAPHPSAAVFLALRSRAPASSAFVPPAATKHAGCKMHGGLPDSACTPGAVMTTDLDVVCHQSTRDRRHVEASVHKEAFTDYGYTYPQARGAFEVDHLIPLELGGDNTIENLWAQPANPKPGFHEKDHVEDYLHKQVCSGAMTLDEAQKMIAIDWLSVWKKMNAGGDDGEEQP